MPSVEKTLHSHPEIEISFKFIPKILMSKECIHFFGPLCIYIYKGPRLWTIDFPTGKGFNLLTRIYLKFTFN